MLSQSCVFLSLLVTCCAFFPLAKYFSISNQYLRNGTIFNSAISEKERIDKDKRRKSCFFTKESWVKIGLWSPAKK
jgi:hypothetical protein